MDANNSGSTEAMNKPRCCMCPYLRLPATVHQFADLLCGGHGPQVTEPGLRNGEKEITLLLLGAASTGKTTLHKQARLLHGDGFPDQERANYTLHIRHNVVQCMSKIVKAMINLEVEYQNPVLENKIQEHDLTNVENVILRDGRIMLDSDYIVECVNLMLSDTGVEEVMIRGDEYHMMENAGYLFERVELIFSESYLPTVDDILKMRYPTQGVTKSDFTIQGRKFVFYDVGGQVGERKKWIHCFDSVKVIMFLASIAEYDQVIESPKYGGVPDNRMKDSLSIFKWIMEYPYFSDTTTVLFLNKQDIFLQKIMRSHICDYFPDYEGPKQNAVTGELFIREMFMQYARRHYTYAHTVECTDNTGAFACIFRSTTEEISRNYIGDLV